METQPFKERSCLYYDNVKKPKHITCRDMKSRYSSRTKKRK